MFAAAFLNLSSKDCEVNYKQEARIALQFEDRLHTHYSNIFCVPASLSFLLVMLYRLVSVVESGCIAISPLAAV